MQNVLRSFALFAAILSGFAAFGDDTAPFLAPWPDDVPYPAPAEIRFPKGIYHSIVHDCDTDPGYKFLHETAKPSDLSGTGRLAPFR